MDERNDETNATLLSLFHGRMSLVNLWAANGAERKRQITRLWSKINPGG